MKLKSALLISTLTLLLVPGVHAQGYTLKSLALLVYNDGVVQVDYGAETDPSLVMVEVELPGFPYESLLTVDQDGLPLDFSVTDKGVLIDTLGSTSVVVTYLTSSLTSKTGAIWTLNFTSTITTSITLPQNSTIVNLSEVPVEIGTDENRPYVRMLPGDISVSYITSVFDARGKAEEALGDAEQHIQQMIDDGIVVSDALDLLEQAHEAFDMADYSTAIQLATQAEDAADEAAADAFQAQELMDEASLAISEADSEGRTKGLDVAEQLMSQAAIAFDVGEYESAYDYAFQSQITALNAEKPQNIYVYALAAILLALGAVAYTRLFKGQGERSEPSLEVDLDAIYRDHPTLRMDDREVIRYIAESGGELFSNEIRERFDIPRTSAWRMLRRLEGLDILEERKVGGQSLVSIHDRYRRPET
jgi:uncharacterized membrane protein